MPTKKESAMLKAAKKLAADAAATLKEAQAFKAKAAKLAKKAKADAKRAKKALVAMRAKKAARAAAKKKTGGRSRSR